MRRQEERKEWGKEGRDGGKERRKKEGKKKENKKGKENKGIG